MKHLLIILNILSKVRFRRVSLVEAVAALLALAAMPAAAATDGPQVWLVSTRGAPHRGDLESGAGHISYWRLDPAQASQWLKSDARAFHDSCDPSVPTTLFVHGNQIDADVAVEEGWALYLQMQQQAAGRSFRLVIWSWPSDRIGRRYRPDVRIKAALSDVEGFYLARTLADLKQGTRLSLVGYSLGARVITAAMQMLTGVQVAGHRLSPEAMADWSSDSSRPIRVMLLAAAMDADWLTPGHRGGLALPMIERALVTLNGNDLAMRFYPRLYGRRGPEALGHVGPIHSDRDKIETVDVSRSVGRHHNWYLYAAAPAVVQRLAWYTFLESPDDNTRLQAAVAQSRDAQQE